MMFANSAGRVRRHTPQSANVRIDRKIQADIGYFVDHPAEISQRLRELEQEWDTERWLQMNSSSISLLGLFLGVVHTRKWFILPAAVQVFFLQHGLQGWCPPLPLLRRLGVRTQGEIETERAALKALSGDREVDVLIQRDDFAI